MLEDMNNTDLIDFVNDDPDSSEAAIELAMRLGYAIDELNRMSEALTLLEVKHGAC